MFMKLVAFTHLTFFFFFLFLNIYKEMSDIRIQIKSAEDYILTLFLVDDVDTALKYRVVLDYYEDRFGDLVIMLDRIKNPKE